jgi:hypothetical protein
MKKRQQRVNCRRCRYRFPIPVPLSEGWRVEAQCPSCEDRAYFTVADTPERETPSPEREKANEEYERKIQRLGEQLSQPINANRDHPVVAWFVGVGNGMVKGDRTPIPWEFSCWVYGFSRGREAAYVWQQDHSWLVRGWHSKRGVGRPPDPTEVASFEAALDQLKSD